MSDLHAIDNRNHTPITLVGELAVEGKECGWTSNVRMMNEKERNLQDAVEKQKQTHTRLR